MRGNPYAQDRLLTRIEKAERERSASIDAENAIASDYVETRRAQIRSAQESGQPEPEFYPHPDDVVIVPGQPFQIWGPASKDEAAIYRNIVATRNLLIMQATLAPLPQDQQISIELLLAIRMNDSLPARMRLDDDAWFHSDWRSRRTPRRQLEKKIQSAWRDLGIDVPRGFTFRFLDREQFKRRLAQVG